MSNTTTSRREAGMGFILVTMLIDILGIGLILPVLPEIVGQLTRGTSYSTSTMFGLLIGVYALMQFAFAPLIGALSDRFGRRPVLLTSIGGLGFDFLLTYFAPNIEWMFAARILSGITAANITAANAYIADVSAPEDRVRNFGRAGAMIGMGLIIGPALGGLLGASHARLPFLVAAGVAGLNFLYGLFVLPESLPPERRQEPVPGTPLGLRTESLNPFGTLLTLQRYPAVYGLAFIILCMSLAQMFLQSTWLLYTLQRFNWHAWQNGMSLAFVGVLMVLVQGGMVEKIAARLGEPRTLLLGLLLSMVTWAMYGLATQGWMMYVVMVPGALSGIVIPAAQALVTHKVGADEQGAVQGALTSLGSLSAVVVPPVATYLFAHFSDGEGLYVPGIAFFAGAFFMGVATLAALRFVAQNPQDSAGVELSKSAQPG